MNQRILTLLLATTVVSFDPPPVRHIQQLPFQCLLAATAQIAPALDYGRLSQTYTFDPISWQTALDWSTDNLPHAYSRLWQQLSDGNGQVVNQTPAGVGILVFSRPNGSTHAVSYAAGMIYDPKQPQTTYHSLTEYLNSTLYDSNQPVRAYMAPPP